MPNNVRVTSKLSENEDIKRARERLSIINLYSPENVYDVSNPAIVEAINFIVNTLDPGNSFDLRNTLLGRVGGLLGLDTPIAQVGAIALIDQWKNQAISSTLNKRSEVIGLRSLKDRHPDLDNNFEVRDVNITTDVHDNFDFEKILDAVKGDNPFDNPINENTSQSTLFNDLTNPGTRGIIKSNLQRNIYAKWVNGNVPLRSISYYLYGADNRFIQQENGYHYLNTDIDVTADNGYLTPNKIPNEDETSIDNHVDKNVISSRGFREEQELGVGEINTTNPNDGFPEKTKIVYDNNEESRVIGNRGLLYYTNKIVSDSERASSYMKLDNEEVGDENLSRGSGVSCRVFHKLRQYDKYKAEYETLMRLEGNGKENSVARDFVVPKIHPYGENDDYKRYMLSIENLAYSINESGIADGDPFKTKFPACEIGNQKGRLMWFAPYGIEFNENTSVNWNSDEFVGRPEMVYTYNNAERTANLSFMLIMDYTEELVANRETIADVIAGCEDPTTLVQPTGNKTEIEQDVEEEIKKLTPDPIPTRLPRYENDDVVYYFPNDVRTIDGSRSYELNGSFSDPVEGVFVTRNNPRGKEYGLNNKFLTNVALLVDFIHNQIVIPEYEQYYIFNFEGYASRLFQTDVETTRDVYNRQLALDRAEALRDFVILKYEEQYGTFPSNITINVITNSDDEASVFTEDVSNINELETKLSRNAELKIVSAGSILKEKELSESEKQDIQDRIRQLEEKIAEIDNAQTGSGCGFARNEYQSNFEIGFDKIDYFSPAFHSQTPEDFHKRLTFLNQCTRTGSNLQNSDNANNVVFGRPPFCILRLGDFIHTKCLITSLDVDYTEDVWDLNPEGMGVQYMIAKVNLSLVLFGGQSLKWAIERIQNAFDFNYYANSTFGKYKTSYYSKAIDAETRQTNINEQSINYE